MMGTVDGPLEPAHIEEFQEGITFLDGRKCKPAKLEILTSSLTESQALVTLSEGKFHQVKKMFLAIGVKVTALKRVRFGPFTLEDGLKEGQYRPLTSNECDAIRSFLEETR